MENVTAVEDKESTDRLAYVSQELLDSYAPVIVFLFILAVVGISGNVSTAVYFGKKKKKTSTEMFITILAVVDLVVCVLIFIYVWQLFVNISVYTHKSLCKASYFIYHWGILLSVAMLCAIAVDRFKKICRPFEKQFNSKTALRISLALLLGSSIISSRDFVTYDSFAVNVTISDVSVEGRICMNTRDETLYAIVTVSHVIDVLIVSAILIILVVSYVAIVYTLYKHNRKMEQRFSHSNSSGRKQSNSCPDSPTTQTSNGSWMNFTSNPNAAPRSRFSLAFVQKISKSERATTLMMLTVSVGLVVCFLPYFIATLIKLRGANVEYELTAWYRFAISSVLANSVINPIVYCMFNPKYRRFVIRAPMRIVRRKAYGVETSENSTDATQP